MSVIPSSSYSDDIVDLTKDFTGREWVFRSIDEWMQSGEEKVFLITGGPGTGKTALASQLFQMSLGDEASEEYPSLGEGFISFAHFCQAFNDPTLIPLRFIEYLSKHLANRYPPFREALLQAGEQNVTIVSSVVAGSAETVAGVIIEELRIGDLKVREAFDRLVRKPLEHLHSQEPHEKILILVDSLDEAQTINIDENIMTLIADVTDHTSDLPDNVRFMLTSRSDPRVMKKIGKRPFDEVLDLIIDAPDDVDDVRDYAHRRLKMLQEPRRSNFASRVAEAAEGNFLYVRYLLDDLIPGIEQVEDLIALSLPKGLDGIYRGFIEREITRKQERWEDYYRPLLGVISVTRGDGLTREMLAMATGLKQSKTDDILRACNQYLSGSYPEGPFRIYHQSFREFLIENSEYPVYPAEAHEAIADMYLSLEKEKWDAYGWIYLPFHLSNAGRIDELRLLLLDFDWMQSKLDVTDVQELLSDYDYLPGDAELSVVQGAIRLSSHILARDRKQLAGQLLGRLQSTSKPDIQDMLEAVKQWRGSPWLRPLTSSLQSPEGPLIRTLMGHTNSIVSAVVTPDGRHAVSASYDNTLKVWSIESGEELHTLEGHTDDVEAVAVTPDGKHAISASEVGKLKVWSLESGEELHTLNRHTDSVFDVAVTPDGRYAVSASDDYTLKVWNIESGKELHTLKGHSGPVKAVAVTPDGKYAVSASRDSTLKVWSIESGEEFHTMKGHTKAVWDVAVTPDGKHAVSASDDYTLKVWSIERGEELYTLKGHTDSINGVAITPDGRQAVSVSEDYTIKLWILKRGKDLHTLKGHTDIVNVVAVTPDRRHAISASWDRTLKVWSIETGKEVHTLKGHIDGIRAVAMTPDGRHAVSGSWDGTLKVWNIESGEELHTLTGHTADISGIAVTPDGRHAVSASGDRTMKVWSIESGEELHTLTGYIGSVYSVAVMPDGRHAISASWDRTLKVWSIESGEKLHTLTGHTSNISGIAVTPDGRHAISGSWDKTLKVWNIESGEELRTLRGHTDIVRAVAVTPDGRHAVSASDDCTLKVWSIESGEELHTLKGHTGSVTVVAVTMKGRRVISASEDHTLKVWDLENRGIYLTFSGDSSITTFATSSDGSTIVIGERSGRVHILKLEN